MLSEMLTVTFATVQELKMLLRTVGFGVFTSEPFVIMLPDTCFNSSCIVCVCKCM